MPHWCKTGPWQVGGPRPWRSKGRISGRSKLWDEDRRSSNHYHLQPSFIQSNPNIHLSSSKLKNGRRFIKCKPRTSTTSTTLAKSA